MATKIITHVQDSLDRLLEQYKTKPRIEGLISCLVEEIQELEDVVHKLPEDLTIVTAIGIQLDLIGTIVVQDRLGFSDTIYRSLLQAKIGENVSKSTPENIIDVVKLLTGATLVDYQEAYPAGSVIGINTDIDPALIDFFYDRIERVDPAAVRLDSLACFDPDEGFTFDGGPGPGEGFGDLTAPLVGGVFGKIHVRKQPAFAFALGSGASNSDQGFGDLNDNLFGGILI